MFYLTTGELFAFVDGRGVTNHLAGLVELRRQEYDGYKKVYTLILFLSITNLRTLHNFCYLHLLKVQVRMSCIITVYA